MSEIVGTASAPAQVAAATDPIAPDGTRARVALLRARTPCASELATYAAMLPGVDVEVLAPAGSASGELVPIRRALPLSGARFGPAVGPVVDRVLRAAAWLRHGRPRALWAFDVVHTLAADTTLSRRALAGKRRFGSKFVVTVTDTRPLALGAGSQGRRDAVLRGADLVVAATERTRQCLLVEGLDTRRIVVVPLGVDVARFHPEGDDGGIRQRLGIGPDAFVILSMAPLDAGSGHEHLVHALKRLVLDRDVKEHEVRLVLAGEGPRSSLRRLLKRTGMAASVILTRFEEHEHPAAYRSADVVALASTRHPDRTLRHGFVLAEAMACGRPVVTTHSGAIPEIVADAGILVPAGDFLGLTVAFKRLLQNPDRCTRLGAFARSSCEQRYDLRLVASRLADEYARLIDD